MKRKRMAAIIIMMLTALLLGACGKKSEAVGTWKIKTVEASGVSMDLNEYTKQTGITLKMEFTFKDDKSFTMDAMGQTAKGTWEEKDGTISATVDGNTQELKLKDGKLIMENEALGVGKVIFEK